MSTCFRCGSDVPPPLYAVGAQGLNRGLCERCADRMILCLHVEGERQQSFDGDGCGRYIWRCRDCGFEEFDPLG